MTKEERKLKKWKEEIEKKDIPTERLDQAIQIGFEAAKGKRENKKRRFLKRGLWSTAIAAILMLTLITSIRVSPAFANAVASIPGMSGFVELIENNKGLQMAIENEHFQVIGTTGETESMKVTLEGIITDETSLVAFSTIETNKKYPNRYLSGYRILDIKGEEIPNQGSFGTAWDQTDNFKLTNTTEINFNGKMPTEEMILEYKISEEVGENKVKETIQIPFKVDLKPVKKEHYTIDKTVIVEGQSIRIRSISIGSLKTAIEVEYDSANMKKIFGFEDLRLVDEKGEVWSSIKNGSTARGTDDPNINIFYLQSNYFRETEHLTLKFSKLMAMDKDEAFINIDTEKKEIVKQPTDERFGSLKVNGRFIDIEMRGMKGYYHDPFSTFFDADGKELSMKSGTFYTRGEDEIHLGIELPDEEYKNPLRFPLYAYPSYIKGNVQIKIK